MSESGSLAAECIDCGKFFQDEILLKIHQKNDHEEPIKSTTETKESPTIKSATDIGSQEIKIPFIRGSSPEDTSSSSASDKGYSDPSDSSDNDEEEMLTNSGDSDSDDEASDSCPRSAKMARMVREYQPVDITYKCKYCLDYFFDKKEFVEHKFNAHPAEMATLKAKRDLQDSKLSDAAEAVLMSKTVPETVPQAADPVAKE